MTLETGIRGEQSVLVTAANTAKTMGSGTLGVGLLLHLEPTALGVSVLMTGMPTGATAAIFAAKYGSDAPFAARNVVFTTLLSMLTLPLWAYAVG